jgi:hypothetical protein
VYESCENCVRCTVATVRTVEFTKAHEVVQKKIRTDYKSVRRSSEKRTKKFRKKSARITKAYEEVQKSARSCSEKCGFQS